MALSKSKQAALKVMTERAGTDAERKTAKAMLAKVKTAQPPATIKAPKWVGDGIARPIGGSPILSSQIKHFLNNVWEHTPFSYKNIPYTDNFGSGHFYGIVNFLQSHNLLTKDGGQYTIANKKAVRDAWNKLMEDAKV